MKVSFVCCTADALKKEVSINRANVLLSPNGVNLEHWKSSDKPNKNSAFYKELKGRNSHNLPVIGYHGALAKWIDYDLLKKISKTGDYFLLIIGQQYDDSLKKKRTLIFSECILCRTCGLRFSPSSGTGL